MNDKWIDTHLTLKYTFGETLLKKSAHRYFAVFPQPSAVYALAFLPMETYFQLYTARKIHLFFITNTPPQVHLHKT